MKSLPDISTSSQFWAAIATMWGAAGAWFTFFAARMSSRGQNRDAIANLIAGIEAELALVSLWASGSEGDLGYLQAKTIPELTGEHEDWFHPSRQIFGFDAPALSALTTSAELHLLTPLITPLVRLNYSIRRVFDLHSELRAFALAHPALYDSVERKLAKKPNVYTEEEKVYMGHIFGLNRRVHQQLIGGADSTDDSCLYKSFRNAKAVVEKFKAEFRPQSFPCWYWLLHFIAAILALNGLWQILRWFDVPALLRQL